MAASVCCRSMYAKLISFLGVVLITSTVQAQHTFHELELSDGARLRYALVLPRDFDPETAYPALLALPPGGQDETMVAAGLGRYWGHQAAERGWLVVSPVAPQGVLFFVGSERYVPELLGHIRSNYEVAGGRFHVAGNSMGGRSAFRIALDNPKDFASLIALPGFPTRDDFDRLDRLAGLPVRLFVGGEDRDWIEPMQRTRDLLADLGNDVSLTVFPGEGHVPPSLDGGRFMEELTAVHNLLAGLPSSDDSIAEEAAVSAILDALHDAASKADGERYFGLFAPRAVFFGTAPGERWTIERFRAYAEPRFATGVGWTYHLVARNIFLADSGDTAWFDESLDNATYGRCRGTGVLVKVAGEWKIAQYNLTFPIPDELAPAVVEKIRSQ